MAHLLRIALVLFLLVAPQTAYAADDAAAQAFFEKGAALYFEGKYAEALVQFKKGHAESPNAMFQYNIAVCNLRLERYREALAAAREAKAMGGLDEKDAAQNEARIVAVFRILAAQNATEEIQLTRDTKALADTALPDNSGPEPQPESRARFGGIGWAGVGATAVGTGLMVGALAVEASLQPKWDDYRAAGDAGDSETYNTLKGEIEDQQGVGRVLLYSGIGFAAVGATLIVVDLLTPGEQPTAGVFVTPDGVGGAFALRF